MSRKRGFKSTKTLKNKSGFFSLLNKKISNKLAYTIIAVFALIVVGLGVFALGAGETPNPGHNIQSIGPPNPCDANQFLKFDGTNWVCESISVPSGGDSVWIASGSNIYYNNGKVGIGTSTPQTTLDVSGSITLTSGDPDGPRIIFTSQGYNEWRVRNGFGVLGFFPGENQPTLLALVNNSGSSRVGIGTTDPQATLHVDSSFTKTKSFCEGTPTSCSSFTNKAQCTAQGGCSWETILIPQDCSGFVDQASCESKSGCTWYPIGGGGFGSEGLCTGTYYTSAEVCTGTPNSCSNYNTNKSYCEAQQNCSWKTEPNTASAIFKDNVGIGTTSPTNRLSVVGSADISGSLSVGNMLVIGYEIISADVPPNSFSATAYCSSRKRVIGGGCDNELSGYSIESSHPVKYGFLFPTYGWECRFSGRGNGTAYAICARLQ
ncbi:MAG: hypothetical protein KatS3mg001_177 [Candidatus Pacearchaeota archaeon]|nr:MAG: hypothetical protein KatS3mg001_177 [Candidatus Pacearchaeota archaeon]